jgi:aminopeptidase N
MRKLCLQFAGVLAASIVASAGVRAASVPVDSRQVLPSGILPSHYDLQLMPDAEHLTFKGVVTIDVSASAPVPDIVLNAKGLTFDSTRLDGVPATLVNLDPALGRATLAFPRGVSAGAHKLTIAYHGAIGRETFGFFAMDYDTASGKRRTLATNFEPAGARMLMPCWDEPARKATFSVSIDTPADRMAVANMPVAADTPLAGGMHRVRFATTPKMSTYLLFVTVGDYERVHRTVDGVDVGVVVKRGDTARAAYGLDQASALLHYYDDWYGIRFPLPKLDLIAAPGEITGGSMENWGSIFYGQNDLLFDPRTSPAQRRQWVFLVVSHEMAHQWFGDLVTMAWWDNLWLNEGFARWMQTHAADALHPEWRTGLQAQRIYESGKQLDATPGSHPVLQPVVSAEQAAQAFDAITYNKGAAVIAMLEAYMGPDAFRDGVRRYMRAHAYGNTVDDDLWREMPVPAGKPVLGIEHDFTRQAGLPLVRVDETASGTVLKEDRFRDDASQPVASRQSWRMPVAVQARGGPAETVLLESAAQPKIASGSLVNAGAVAYARVLYPQAHVTALAARMPTLADVDRLTLLNDASALGKAGYADGSNVLAYIDRLPAKADPIVWKRAVDLLTATDQILGAGSGRDRFRRWARAVLAPVAARIGRNETAGEDANAADLRSSLLLALAAFGDDGVVEWAHGVRTTAAGTAADRQSALEVTASRANAATFDALLAEARTEHDPLERGRVLEAMATVRDPALAARFVSVAVGPDAPAGAAPQLLALAARTNPDAVWTTLRPHLDDPTFPIGLQEQLFYIPYIAGRSSRPERVAELRAWADRHLPADTRQDERAAASSIAQNVRYRDRAVPEISRWLDRVNLKAR